MLAFDIETDGLLDTMTKIHCIVICDINTGEYTRYDKENRPIEEGVERLRTAKAICGHNALGFDVPAINIVYKKWVPEGTVYDSMVWARVAYPDISNGDWQRLRKRELPRKLVGSHSLKAYGIRMRVYKDDFGETTDWKEWSREMSDYCERDVEVLSLLIQRLRDKDIPRSVLRLEHRVQTVYLLQKKNGILFDMGAAEDLYGTLVQEKADVDAQLRGMFDPWYEAKGKVFVPARDNKSLGYKKGCALQHIKMVTFNPNSDQHIGRILTKNYGWKPKEFTKEYQPVVSEVVLADLKYDIAPLLIKSQMLKKRLGQLGDGRQALMKSVGEDGRIHGSANTNGAVTARWTHMYPNMAQVPSLHNARGPVPYGKEFRELMCVREGKKLVGIDASGLELRGLAHFMAFYDKGEYAKVVLSGDVHSYNQEMAGIDTRDRAKRFI